MSSDDILDSWIEVTPHGLGYHPIGPNNGDSVVHVDSGGFEAIVEERLFTSLLTEAQEHSNHESPPSPPPSREEAGLSGIGRLPPALLYAAASKAASLSSGPGEWASRPEIGSFTPVMENSDAVWHDSLETELATNTWSIRNSFMKSQVFCWLLDHIPSLLSHAAAFLLGATTVFFMLRKRVGSLRLFNFPLE